MIKASWSGVRTALVAGIIVTGAFVFAAPSAHAAGALAIGDCGAWGGSWNYDSMSEARRRALRECDGDNCKIVTTFRGLCAAFAVDFARRCGAWGWATRTSMSAARRVAIQECENAGGTDCRVRTPQRFCDDK